MGNTPIPIVAFLSRIVHSQSSQKELLSRILSEISVHAFALDEKVCFTALRSLKKYDPGAKCGIMFYIMYFKFAPMQKYGFLIVGNFVDQGKKMPTHVIN